ncbi:hypothetical protein BDY24DRAFT_382511 [Mrakia frigida]|uniref:uncharacterized protein n=1 Tax=Mrakia frigida TaxID=29902 RepID=UPI003FCBFF36
MKGRGGESAKSRCESRASRRTSVEAKLERRFEKRRFDSPRAGKSQADRGVEVSSCTTRRISVSPFERTTRNDGNE